MTKDVAFAVTNAIAGLIEAMGMQAENQYFRATRYHSPILEDPPYREADFKRIIEERGLSSSDLVMRILHSG